MFLSFFILFKIYMTYFTKRKSQQRADLNSKILTYEKK